MFEDGVGSLLPFCTLESGFKQAPHSVRIIVPLKADCFGSVVQTTVVRTVQLNCYVTVKYKRAQVKNIEYNFFILNWSKNVVLSLISEYIL